MAIYLAIVWTYLSIIATLLIFFLAGQKEEYAYDKQRIEEENRKWKEEVRSYFNNK